MPLPSSPKLAPAPSSKRRLVKFTNATGEFDDEVDVVFCTDIVESFGAWLASTFDFLTLIIVVSQMLRGTLVHGPEHEAS